MSGEESENKPRVLLAVLLSPHMQVRDTLRVGAPGMVFSSVFFFAFAQLIFLKLCELLASSDIFSIAECVS